MVRFSVYIFASILCLSSVSMGEEGILSKFLKESSRGIHDWLSRFAGKPADSNPEKSSDSSNGKSSGTFPDWSSFIPFLPKKSSDSSNGASSGTFPDGSSFNPASWPTASPGKSADSSPQGSSSFPGEPGILSSFFKGSSGGFPDWSSFFPSSGKQADSNPEKSSDSSPGKSSGKSDWSSFCCDKHASSPGKSADSSPQGFGSFPGASVFQNIFGGGRRSSVTPRPKKNKTRKTGRKVGRDGYTTPEVYNPDDSRK